MITSAPAFCSPGLRLLESHKHVYLTPSIATGHTVHIQDPLRLVGPPKYSFELISSSTSSSSRDPARGHGDAVMRLVERPSPRQRSRGHDPMALCAPSHRQRRKGAGRRTRARRTQTAAEQCGARIRSRRLPRPARSTDVERLRGLWARIREGPCKEVEHAVGCRRRPRPLLLLRMLLLAPHSGARGGGCRGNSHAARSGLIEAARSIPGRRGKRPRGGRCCCGVVAARV